MPRKLSAEPHIPKYRQVLETLAADILSGKYQAGQKFPSEAALVQQFRTSRITVGRALRELSERGLVERIAGSGTYVRRRGGSKSSLLFGLLIADLGNTEIFEPICRGIAAAPQASQHALLWGHSEPEEGSRERQALDLCDQYIRRHVSGVFFAPVEHNRGEAFETNLTILRRLEAARIPVVLLDRRVMLYPAHSRHDLVGIDNRRAGYIATEHLLKLGARRIAFLAHAGGASTIDARIAGFREALLERGRGAQGSVHRVERITEATVRPLLSARKQGDAFVCANDRTAGELMHALPGLGYRVPEEVRIVGVDDVEYASLLPVPLTTVHQPCREIGEAAMAAMLDRIDSPNAAVRDILVECRLVIRDSCGARVRSVHRASPGDRPQASGWN